MTHLEFPNVLRLADYCGIGLYDWQATIDLQIDAVAEQKRIKFAVRAPNGVGKTQRIICLAAARWMQRFPKGRVIVTSFDARQIDDQFWPAFKRLLSKFPDWHAVEAQHKVDTPEGGRLRAFTTDDPGRAEGFHRDDSSPLLVIIDEAKSIPSQILQAIDRCSYNVLLYISSPGVKEGPFYDAFTVNSERFKCFHAGLTDCPHIDQEKIDDIVSTYGGDHPFTKSTLHGEFMDYGEGIAHILELPELENWRNSSIGFMPGPTVLACDFACGGDDNVILHRVGNRIAEIVTWKDVNTANATGRFVRELRRMGYSDKIAHLGIFGDATGPGKPFCDLIREYGIPMIDFNFGGSSDDKAYKDEGTRIWYQTAHMIRQSQIVVPPHNQDVVKKLFAQLTQRRQKMHSSGKVWMESKEEMKKRGLKSPDVADALCMAFGLQPAMAYSYVPYDDNERQEIARRHGWDYTPETDYGFPGRNNDDTQGNSWWK